MPLRKPLLSPYEKRFLMNTAKYKITMQEVYPHLYTVYERVFYLFWVKVADFALLSEARREITNLRELKQHKTFVEYY
jgi:nicotinic acid phosphoribosyltransferase